MVTGFYLGKISYWPPCTAGECAQISAMLTLAGGAFDKWNGDNTNRALWFHWLAGSGADMVMDYEAFDNDRNAFKGWKATALSRARLWASRQPCGTTGTHGFTSSWMPAPTAATPQMILKYEMKVAYRCSVSKSCGTSGCCESLATDCSLLITTRDRVDFNEGWGVPGDMMHHGVDKWIEGAGVRIMDDAVNYCFELGRPGGGIAVDFDIHASHSESFSRTHDCK